MKLTTEYLKERHTYWKNKIGDRGIWNVGDFTSVGFKIRKNHRRYNALFQRKIRIREGKREISDLIVFYNKVENCDSDFIDNVLVHEMIHQYIFQTGIKDTSSHGKVFKDFMNRINRSFEGKLVIRLRDTNPGLPERGRGEKDHVLLFLHLSDENFLCAVINPAKQEYFESQLKRNKKRWDVQKYWWAKSKDVYFSRFSRCTLRIHGIKLPISGLNRFYEDFEITDVTSEKIPGERKLLRLFRRR